MEGFETVPVPLIEVADETRERLISTVAAMVFAGGSAPAEIVGFLKKGFPPEITVGLERAGEREQIGGYVDVILHVLQSPGAGA